MLFVEDRGKKMFLTRGRATVVRNS